MNALFQSTFPLQGTTADQLQDRAAGRISIHVPIAGNDEDMLNNRLSEDNHISIHVPIAGNDAVGMASSSFLGIFQSTFPLQGTTVIIPFFCIIINISIHVPIAGNDDIIQQSHVAFFISIHVPIAGNDSKLIQFLIYNCKIFVLYYSYL